MIIQETSPPTLTSKKIKIQIHIQMQIQIQETFSLTLTGEEIQMQIHKQIQIQIQETCSLTLTSGKILFQFPAFILHTLSFTFIPIFRGGLLQGVKKRARLKVNRLVLTGHGQVQFHHSLFLL